MVRTVTCSLKPTATQAEALLATMEAFNAACDYVSSIAWTEREFNNYRLRKRTYGTVRERFGLPAQLAQQAIAKTVRRTQRATFSAWSFHELRSFLTYKAEAVGIPVFFVDPKNTSRTCPACGHIDKANRKSQSVFSCVLCQCSGLADHFAAVEVGRRAVLSQPFCSVRVSDQPEQIPPLERWGSLKHESLLPTGSLTERASYR